MISAVFDCMVFLQSATSDRGPAFACLELAESNEVTLYISPDILGEVRDVLIRPELQARFPHLTADRVAVFLLKLANVAVVMHDVPNCGFTIRDCNDAPYLNLAIAAGASYLVSRDKDLLDLMKERSFVAAYPQLQIVAPLEFLTVARTKQSP